MTDSNGHNEEALQRLIDSLGSGDESGVEKALLELGTTRESQLFDRVGGLARTLHDSLQEFQNTLQVGKNDMHSTTLPDAASKLEAVIQLTFDAAQTTLSNAEAQEDALATWEERLIEFQTSLETNNELSDEAKAELAKFLTENGEIVSKARERNTEIMMAQTFQDLSGQALQKVIQLVTSLEQNLVELITLFGVEKSETKVVETEVQSTTDTRDAGALDQDDVDDVLKSFGF